MDKQANNELIARFMGWSPDNRHEKSGDFHVWTSKESKNAILGCYLNYDSDWNWLMPVWEKIGKIKIESGCCIIDEMEIRITKCYIKALPIPYTKNKSFIALNIIGDDGCEKLIDTVYKSVLEFIKWYNEQKK